MLVEKLQTRTLERLGLGPDVPLARNLKLVVTLHQVCRRPWCHAPGFATIAEAMSGFAAINGRARTLLPPPDRSD